MLNAVQLDTVCVFTIVTCECPLNFPVHTITFSYKWKIQIMQLSALRKPVNLPPTNHTVYVINTHDMHCHKTLWLYCEFKIIVTF